MTNDFLLLHYGFVQEDNPFQEFWLKFEIESNQETYDKLEKEGFDMETILLKDGKVRAYFGLTKKEINSHIIKFFEIVTGHSYKEALLAYKEVIEANLKEILEQLKTKSYEEWKLSAF